MSATRKVDLFVPGRVCLLGEHSDWAGSFYDPARNPHITHGRCIAYGTSLGLYTHASATWLPATTAAAAALPPYDAAATMTTTQPSHYVRLSSVLPDGAHKVCEAALDMSTMRQGATDGGFFAYMFGTIHVLLAHYQDKIFASQACMAVTDSDGAAATTTAASQSDEEAALHAQDDEQQQQPSPLLPSSHDDNNSSRRGATRASTLCVVLHNYKTDMPVKRGLSSSAAICVTVVRAFNVLFDLDLSTEQEMELAYQGEIMTGSQCGRLDQCVAFGKQCVDLYFTPDGVTASAIDMTAGAHFHFVVADLCAGKDTKKILRELHACYVDSDTTHAQQQQHASSEGSSSSSSGTDDTKQATTADDDGDNKAQMTAERAEVRRGVQCFLGQRTLDHVAAAAQAIKRGDAQQLGAVFTAYQADFDRYLIPACDELRAPKLHATLAHPRVRALSCGGKGIGSQGDGSVQFVCRNAEEQAQLCELLNTPEMHCCATCFTL